MPRNPKRADFETREDFREVRAVVRLARLALAKGASRDEVTEALGNGYWFAAAINEYLAPEYLPCKLSKSSRL